MQCQPFNFACPVLSITQVWLWVQHQRLVKTGRDRKEVKKLQFIICVIPANAGLSVVHNSHYPLV